MNLAGKRAIVFGGATGLLGMAVSKALMKNGVKTVDLSSSDMDILDQDAVQKLLEKEKPDFLINAVAYTQVDLAEDEEEKAFALNSTAPALLATQAARFNIPFIHFSTDFVFNGNRNTPYTVEDKPNAKSVYGISKAAGEKGLLELGYEKTLIIRTSWLFGPNKTNFVHKILGFSREREELKVVNDQTGSPSYTPDVAEFTLKLIQNERFGIFHVANSGTATWFDLASTAVEMYTPDCTVTPVTTEEFPTKASRPNYSVLDLTALEQAVGSLPRHWRSAVEEYVKTL